MQRKHNLYRDSMVMHNSDPNLHLLGEGIPIDWGEEYSGQPEAEPAADKRRRAKQVVSVIQDDEGVLPYKVDAEALLQPGSPELREPEEPDPGVPPSSPDGVEEIREALAKESLGDGVEAEERLTNGTYATRESGATEEVAAATAGSVPSDVSPQGPASEEDGMHCAAPASPAPGAEVPSKAGLHHATPASPMPRADVPSGTSVPHTAPASPVPGADVPSGTSVQHTAPASPKPRADDPSGARMPQAVPASPLPRADVPSEARVLHAAPASPTPGAETPSPSAGMACHQSSDKETGEEVAPPGGECSPPQPADTMEGGEGVQTEF